MRKNRIFDIIISTRRAPKILSQLCIPDTRTLQINQICMWRKIYICLFITRANEEKLFDGFPSIKPKAYCAAAADNITIHKQSSVADFYFTRGRA